MGGWAVGVTVLVLITGLAAARGPRTPAFDQAEQAGYQAFYNLDYPQALADFHRLLRLAPQDPAAWNHLAQARLYQEMYRVGALASAPYGKHNTFMHVRLRPLDPRACAAFLAADRRARGLARQRLARHPRDAAAAYDLAAAWGLKATYDLALRKAYFAALGDAVKAEKYARQAAQERPTWTPPQLILGVHDYVAGSLPWAVRWIARLAGFSGKRKQGIARIRRVAKGNTPQRVEARILLAIVDQREGWNRRAAGWLRALRRRYPRNALFAADLAAAEQAAGEHQRALADYQWLAQVPHPRAPSFAYLPWGSIWYQIGNIERQQRRYSAALRAYRRAQRTPHAPTRWRQKAALAAGEIEDAKGRRQAALADYHRCIALDATAPAARRARRWLRHAYAPGGNSR